MIFWKLNVIVELEAFWLQVCLFGGFQLLLAAQAGNIFFTILQIETHKNETFLEFDILEHCM